MIINVLIDFVLIIYTIKALTTRVGKPLQYLVKQEWEAKQTWGGARVGDDEYIYKCTP